jgi:hypothetical protein
MVRLRADPTRRDAEKADPTVETTRVVRLQPDPAVHARDPGFTTGSPLAHIGQSSTS